jgi:hypothetical protein
MIEVAFALTATAALFSTHRDWWCRFSATVALAFAIIGGLLLLGAYVVQKTGFPVQLSGTKIRLGHYFGLGSLFISAFPFLVLALLRFLTT